MRTASSSALPLIRLCAASFALPHDRSTSDRSNMGDALHEHMHHRAVLGVAEAMMRIDELARRYEMTEREAGIFAARCRSFEWVPPKHAFGEVALALLEDGTVVRVKGGKGEYDLPPGALTAGTLDVMWSEPEPLDISDPTHPKCPPGSMLWVVDYKSGEDTFVEPIEHNAQARTNALMAAVWTGAHYAVPAILFVRKGLGEWDTPEEAMGPRQLAEHAGYVREWIAEVRRQQALAEAGERLDLLEGKHCEFCPGRSRCSAHTAIIKSIITGPAPVGDAPLTVHERTWLAQRLRSIEYVAKKARQVLVADVDAHGPIDLEDGNVWGPFPRKRTTILVKEAVRVLVAELGAEGAREAVAVEESVSRESIEAVVKAQHAAKGLKRQVAPAVRRIFAILGEAGALVDDPQVQYGAHKPKNVEEDLEEQLERSVEGLSAIRPTPPAGSTSGGKEE